MLVGHTFGNAVSLRVISRYTDMLDVVSLLQVGECFDKCRPIVGDDLTKCTPLAQYVFKDPISNGLCSLCAEGMILREMCQGAVALYEVLEAT